MKILNKPAESLAGNLELYLTPISNINYIMDRAIMYKDEDLLLKVICQRETLQHVQTATKTEAGVKYTHKIVASLYGRSNDNDELIAQFMKYKLLAIVRDTFGNYQYVGSTDLGLKLESEYDSGTEAQGVKGYVLTLQGDLVTPLLPMDYLLNLRADVVLQSFDAISG
jgi:hypothetical protein